MKKLLSLLMFPIIGLGQYTQIPDTTFEQKLINLGYDSIQDGQVLTANIVNVDSLDLSGTLSFGSSSSISDFTGLQGFTNLKYLDCSVNPLFNLDVSQNTLLKHLDCEASVWLGSYNGFLQNLDLSNNDSLEYLNCNGHMLSNLDLSSNLALLKLYCAQNHLLNLDLSQNLALTHLDCSGNSLWGGITHLNLSQNTALVHFKCKGNTIFGGPIGTLRHLDIRNGNNTNLTTFNTLNNHSLDCVSVDDSAYSTNNWTNIDTHTIFSNDCNNLLYTLIPDSAFEQRLIDYGYDTIQDGKVLTSNITSIDSLDVSTPPNMFSPPKIYDLTGIESFSNLRFLNCAFNELTNLDLSQNSLLNNVMCGFNNIQNLNISQNINLEHLMCSHNPISSIDLTQNINLKTLNCAVMSINELDVSQNLNLDTINCGYNQILNLNLSLNQSLIALFCGFNQLESLDIRNGNNINFTDFEANNNDSLYCISVDDSTWSTNNWTNIDSITSFSNDCNPSTTDIIEIKKNLSVYPNPTSEKINISVDNFNGNIQTEVFDLIGNRLQVTNETTISLRNYARGIYILKVAYGDRVEEVKVIKD